jgi:hypothetical protein
MVENCDRITVAMKIQIFAMTTNEAAKEFVSMVDTFFETPLAWILLDIIKSFLDSVRSCMFTPQCLSKGIDLASLSRRYEILLQKKWFPRLHSADFQSQIQVNSNPVEKRKVESEEEPRIQQNKKTKRGDRG